MSIPSRHTPLPEGEEKARGGAGDVRRHRSALRPREPRHDVPDGCRLATTHVSTSSRCPAVRSCWTSLRGRATCPASYAAEASRRSASTCQRGCCAPIGAASPVCWPTCCSSPSATVTPTAPRAGSRCATSRDLPSFFGELARVVRVGGRVALLEVATPDNAVMRWGHGIYFGHVVPVIGGWLSDGDAYRYLPRSVAYLPEPDALVDMFRAAGFPDAQRTTLSGGIAQLLTGTRR